MSRFQATALLMMWLAAAFLVSCEIAPHVARAADELPRRSGRLVLTTGQLDRVTAGSIQARIDVSATATGAATAFTQTTVDLRSLHGVALNVRAAPAPMALLGTTGVDITTGTGSAEARGDQSADCSAIASLNATDVIMGSVSAARQATLTTAICTCSLVAVTVSR